MPRENSFSDSEGRSLTPDIEDIEQDIGFMGSPVSSPVVEPSQEATFVYPLADAAPAAASASAPPEVRFRTTVQDAKNGLVSGPKSRTRTMDTTVSAPSVVSGGLSTTSPSPYGAASAKFRSSVRKIILQRRASTFMGNAGVSVGAEPGVDPRRNSAFLNYGYIRANCTIDIVDYSSVRSSFGKFNNRGFIEFLNDPKASQRDPWVKVRWIHVQGLSWDVISAMAMKFDIHPLALEDVLHQRSTQSRSKADYYFKHLFIRVLYHRLAEDEEQVTPLTDDVFSDIPRSSSPAPFTEDDVWGNDEKIPAEIEDLGSSTSTAFSTLKFSKLTGGSIKKKRRNSSSKHEDLENGSRAKPIFRSSTRLRLGRKQAANAITLEQLKRGERVNVDISPLYIFLFRDGTVISLSAKTDLDSMAPIISRLHQRDTGLRSTADPSLLVQSILDLVVDQALEVIDEYQRKILKLEHDVLLQPKVKTVRYLHIISGDLQLHKRTLEPIKTMIYGLRRYDVDRCAALINPAKLDEKVVVEGFMSHKAKIYLADVFDHMDFILTSLDMFAGISENLINYTFNMASYEMNEVMRRLTLVTIICLPLTLLTGYFGMNFSDQPSTMNHSDLYFWKIAIPMMAFVLTVFLYGDMRRLVHYCHKRWSAYRVEKAVYQRIKKTQ